ncbi:hypothetical protein ACFY1J_44395 [Streptomyces sp. NPDC001406]|uniref:hypothetical protein n=1 Tax=Streptomyces sp. NPDC001406 TaxID=3364572 RepID=UPI00368D2556
MECSRINATARSRSSSGGDGDQFLAAHGAAIGVLLNHYDTTKLARRIRADLRARQVPWLAPRRQASTPTDADS